MSDAHEKIEVREVTKIEIRSGLPGPPQSNIIASATAPDDPDENDLWVDLS